MFRALALAVLTCSFALLAGCGGAARATGESAPSPDPYVGIWGAHSKITERTYERVSDAEAWAALWRRHVGWTKPDNAFYNEAGVPDVDFERCMVVAILQGDAWNSAGVRVVSVAEESDRVLFRFEDRSYQTSGIDGGGQKVTAFGFFVVPRSDQPLVLEENVQGLIGKPPKWKERARLE